MSFHEFSKRGFNIISMFEFINRVKEIIFLIAFDEFSKHGFAIPSMFEFSQPVKETIF